MLGGLGRRLANSAQTIFTPAGGGAIAEATRTALRRQVFASQYRTLADAVLAAGDYGEIIFSPNTTYNVSSALTQRAGQRWIGQGGQRSATLKKMFNGDLVTMGTLGEITNLNIDGNGATYSGKNISVASGFSQKISRIRTIDSAGVGIYFAADAGGGAVMSEIEGNSITPLTVGVIGIAGDSTAVPRFLRDSWISGGTVDISGCNDFFIDGLYCHHVITSAGSSNFYISNARWASSGAAISIKGTGGQLSTCAFAGAVTLENSSGIVLDPSCEFGFGITEAAASSLFNSFVSQSSAYTPTWDNATGADPALGNGSITGRYIRQGRTCKIQINQQMGTTSTFGNAGSAWQWTMPFNSHNAFTQDLIGKASVLDASTGTLYRYDAQISANANVLILTDQNQAVRDGFPIAWANGDVIKIELEFSTL